MARFPDLQAFRRGDLSFAEAIRDIAPADLPALTNEVYDALDALLAEAPDAAVVHVPEDPALKEGDPEGAWTLSRVVVHLTASAEESLFQAAELARGVQPAGRSSSEVPWQTIASAEQVRARLRESRRMCLALLGAWPEQPHLDLTLTRVARYGPVNAVGLAMFGLGHAHGHLPQLRDIVRQAQRA